MSKIVADEVLKAKLKNLAELLEIIDEQGNVLGYFSPVGPMPIADANIEIPYSKEELDRRTGKSTGRRLADIIADFEKLP